MQEIKLLYLYPDMMELYGDYGNIQILKYRCRLRDINLIVDNYSIGDEKPDFKSYDIVFAGGGADNEQTILSEDLIKYKEDIKEAVENKTFFLLICGAYQLFGKYYKGVEGNIIPGLEVFDYYTQAEPDRRKRCIGNIVTKVNLDGEQTEVIGFENHGGQTYNIDSYFGEVIVGNGNKFQDKYEGYLRENVIATYLHGPLLSKNPKLADYIIRYCLERKLNKENKPSEKIELKELDDTFEEKCRKQLLDKFIKN